MTLAQRGAARCGGVQARAGHLALDAPVEVVGLALNELLNASQSDVEDINDERLQPASPCHRPSIVNV